MRFRLVDRILEEAPGRIRTQKTISFEEFSLLKPWGRKGAFPETLLLQVAVESAALLLNTGDAARTGVLEGVDDVRFLRETRPGSVLECVVNAEGDAFRFTLADPWGPLASGLLSLSPLPLESCLDPEAFVLQRAAITLERANGAS